MRLTFLFSAVLLTACAPEDASDFLSDPDAQASGTRTATKADEVEVANGSTPGTDKDCDPDTDRECFDGDKIVANGGGSGIHPDPTSDDPIPEFPFGGPRNLTMFLTANSGIPGIDMTLAFDEGSLERAAVSGRAGYADAWVTGQPGGTTIEYVHVIDNELRSGELSLLIELDDRSTWLVEGGIPSGEIEFN